MLRESYNPSVSQLFEAGDIPLSNTASWLDYIEKYGFTTADIPELLQMATDRELEQSSDGGENMAPIHAWRVLGQLKATEAIEPLISQFYDFDDYMLIDAPVTLGLIGPAAIEPLTKVMSEDTDVFATPTMTAISALDKIAKNYPQSEERINQILLDKFEQYAENEADINGVLIQYLVDHKVEAARQLIEQAFEADAVDETFIRIHDVQFGYGEITREERDVLEEEYRAQYQMLRGTPMKTPTLGMPRSPTKSVKAKAKAKAKRKMEKASRKKNRKK